MNLDVVDAGRRERREEMLDRDYRCSARLQAGRQACTTHLLHPGHDGGGSREIGTPKHDAGIGAGWMQLDSSAHPRVQRSSGDRNGSSERALVMEQHAGAWLSRWMQAAIQQ